MITKERLEQLIKENKKVYSIDTKAYNEKILELCDMGIETEFNKNNEIKLATKYGWWHWFNLEDLFEIEEQAEWHLTHHSTRTEELDLPMWEEFKNSKLKWVGFWSKQHDNYWLYLKNKKIKLSRLLDDDYEVEEHKWDATEENYEKACDLCLKLFKGEE